jgi:hypothetical protein
VRKTGPVELVACEDLRMSAIGAVSGAMRAHVMNPFRCRGILAERRDCRCAREGCRSASESAGTSVGMIDGG